MPAVAYVAAHVVLVLTAGVAFYAAFNDLRHYKIRNELILLMAVLFFIHAALSGRWVSLHWNFGFAVLMFAIMLYFYAQRLMGGGDLKLLTVAFLWVGPFCALPFAILLLIFAALHALAGQRGWVEVQEVEGKKRIAFAPSIAGALIGVFLTGCIHSQ